MTTSSRGGLSAFSFIRSSRHSRTRLCSDCIAVEACRPFKRFYAAEAVAIRSQERSASDFDHSAPLVTAPAPSSSPYITKAGILLSRPPILTRASHPFEDAFYFYQKRLNERLAMPFTRYFYYKKDTPADHDWKLKAKQRNGTAARDLGSYQAYSTEGWNDEILVGDKLSKRETAVESLLKDSVMAVNDDGSVKQLKEGEEEEAVERPLARLTDTDKKRDLRKLDRKLHRTLYLVVKGDTDLWRLPSGAIIGRENLHQAAERILVQSGGMNMNTWIVGHVPVGFHVQQPESGNDQAVSKRGAKTFFMKARIMAGQASLKENLFQLQDFKWLTREEVEKHVSADYYSQIRLMLSER